MRTREYDRSQVLEPESVRTMIESGYHLKLDGTIEMVNNSVPILWGLSDRQYGFFIDDPSRPRYKRFGFANRWEERCTPTPGEQVVHNTNYNAIGSGDDNTHLTVCDARPWLMPDALCGLRSNTLSAEEITGTPWPYRFRSRLSLNNSVQRARQRLNQYNGSIAETFGEIPETPRLFSLINTARGLRSNLTNLALGVRFGWLPAYSAFRDGLAELSKWRSGVDAVRRLRGITNVSYRVSDDWSMIEVNPDYVVYNAIPGHRYETRRHFELLSHEGSISYSAVVDLKPLYDERSWDIMSRLARVGAIPSLRTFWELVPRSFLVDWFVAVGDVISDIQGNLLYSMDIKQQCWSWRIHDRIAAWEVSPLDQNHLTVQEVKAFYRSETPPLGSWKVPRIAVPTDLGRLSSLALLVSQVIPDRGASLRSIMRRIKRFGYR